MRGSPFLRTVWYALALILAGFGLSRVTANRPASHPSSQSVAGNPAPSFDAHYELTLSGEAREMRINGRVVTALSGTVTLDPIDPRVALAIVWKKPSEPGMRRFAKLTIDPPGKPTIVHVFDASGDIDDVFEPTIDAVK